MSSRKEITSLLQGALLLAIALAAASPVFANAANQAAMDSFYNLNNIVTVNLAMPQAQWDALRNAYPHSNPPNTLCDFAYVGSRYDWFTGVSVTVGTSQFPYVNGSFTFNNVSVKKKSFCGSFSLTKPSLHLKFASANQAAVEALIGTRYLMLNNSIQDPDYIRQCLGYKLLAQAGLPAQRCNFSRLIVNGTTIGVYVNLEPVKEQMAENNFAGNVTGNMYEFEAGEDFDVNMEARSSWEGFNAPFEFTKADLHHANLQVAAANYAGVVDENAFVRLWAMEIMLKHWDGYAKGRNNTYVYNDIVNPAASDAGVNFKFAPSGIDQILQPWRSYELYATGILANRFAAIPAYVSRLRGNVHFLLNNVFSYYQHTTNTVPFINASVGVVNSLLAQSSLPSVNSANIASITSQLAGLRASMNALFGYDFYLAPADFDGDGKTDRTVWRSSQAKFYTVLTSTGVVASPIFGAAGDIPLSGDFDSDGRVDYALWRPSTGDWDVRNSSTGLHTITALGTNGDIPVVGDFDGDGRADLTVWSNSPAGFFTRASSTGLTVQTVFGTSGDIPVVGNYDGDRKTDYALWRPTAGEWDIYQSSTSSHSIRYWGTNGDVPVARDFDLDGKADISVWRASQAKFYTILSSTNTVSTPIFGAAGDIPTLGDIDADIKGDYGLWRQSTGGWDILKSTTGLHSTAFWGTNGDVPLPRPQN
ncbi:MAG TPA: CotH kinase family protein [Thermoanaerobaculia bacterium]|nr:CotH kinase family protein [Thermoanaerobaculia bacterium]